MEYLFFFLLVEMCWCVDVLMYWCVDVLMTIVLMCWCVDMCVRELTCWWLCWRVDVLMFWCFDVLMCSRRVDVLVCWCVDVLMCWCVDALMSWEWISKQSVTFSLIASRVLTAWARCFSKWNSVLKKNTFAKGVSSHFRRIRLRHPIVNSKKF